MNCIHALIKKNMFVKTFLNINNIKPTSKRERNRSGVLQQNSESVL